MEDRRKEVYERLENASASAEMPSHTLASVVATVELSGDNPKSWIAVRF